MLKDKIKFLSKDFRKARAEFDKTMTGVEDTDPRWRSCTAVTNDYMGVPIGTLYVNKYFSGSTRDKVSFSKYYGSILMFKRLKNQAS